MPDACLGERQQDGVSGSVLADPPHYLDRGARPGHVASDLRDGTARARIPRTGDGDRAPDDDDHACSVAALRGVTESRRCKVDRKYPDSTIRCRAPAGGRHRYCCPA